MKITFKRKAFTLIELLIVIAIIGILFIVLVSKVDFATDKAKTSGVQTDFRSFQVAFEQVSRENAGFNTLGWDTGDIKRSDFNTALAGYTYTNASKDAGDRVRNSYDVGDINLNGELDSDETWTGRKVYTETWTSIYTLDNPGDAADKSAYILLEEAINKNLDPKLHITINPDTKEITMANGYQDPWKTEYHGFYLSNAAVDGKDRGAILMYSDGPNKQFGSAQVIANGVVTIGIPQNNIQGQDDLSILTIYTYFNGYGENKTTTSGFSQNQNFLAGGNNPDINVVPEGPGGGSPVINLENIEGGLYQSGTNYQTRLYTWQELIDLGWITSSGSAVNGMKTNLAGDLKISNTITSISSSAFQDCDSLTRIVIPNSVTSIGNNAFYGCDGLTNVTFGSGLTTIGWYTFYGCTSLTSVTFGENSQLTTIDRYAFKNCTNLERITIPDSVTIIDYSAFNGCINLASVTFGENSQLTSIGYEAFYGCTSLENIEIPDGVTSIGDSAFSSCSSLTSVTIPDGVTSIGYCMFSSCRSLESVTFGANSQLTTIGNYVFMNCTSLKSIEIPDTLTSIGYQAFDHCTSLESVTFGENSQLATIDAGAFGYCSLKNIVIPEGVTGLIVNANSAHGTFRDCTSLTAVTILATTPPIIKDTSSSSGGTFWGCTALTTITIPAGTLSAYQTAWSSVASKLVEANP